jgi:hypothetical protein
MPGTSRYRAVRIGLAALLVIPAPAAPAGAAATAGTAATERVFVTVLDRQGAPVTGLQAADFTVRIDDVDQEVVSAGRAATPASIVLLTDQLGLSPNYTHVEIREAMAAFVKTMRDGDPSTAFSLLTFDGPIRAVTPFKSTPLTLDRAIDRLLGSAPDSVFLDAVIEAARWLRSAPTERRIMFTILSAYRPDQSTERSDDTGDRLRDSKASLWAVEAVRDVAHGGNYASQPRELVLESGTRQSGGGRATVTTRQGLAPAARGIAELILAQYEVTYTAGTRKNASRLQVGVTRPVGRVLAPRWLGK